MKQQFNGTYTFTPSTGVVTLSGIDLPLERLYLIVNTTRNTPIFNFAVSGLGATRTFNAGTVSTSFDVAFDTSSHSSTDRLAIIYDDGQPDVAPVILPKNNDPIVDSIKVFQVSGGRVDTGGISSTYAPIKVTSQGLQEITGAVTANAGTNLNTSALALEAGGNLATIAGRLPAQVNSRVPVEVGNFPSNQVVNLTNVGGTTAATIKGAATASQSSDTALVVALHPASPAMVGQGGSAVSSSNPLLVSLANTGSNATAVNVSAAVTALNATTATPSLGVSEKRVAGSLVQLTATEAIPAVGQTNALFVKNINMVRLSGDTFVEERRPDVCQAGEWNDLPNNGTATIYNRLNSARRIRVNQIIFSWMYAGSAVVNLFGQFVFQYFNEAGTFAGDILKVRLQSGQMHTLTFPNGILSPATGGSVRVVNQSGGGNINTNFNISLWEE